MNFSSLRIKNLVLIVCSIIICFISSCSKGGSNSPTPKSSQPAVTITSLSISQGSYYAGVTIVGTGFDEIYSNDQVFFNGKPAVIDLASSTQIYAHVPLAAGTGNVTIKVKGASATGPVFTYIPALVVSTFAGSFAQGNVNAIGDSARFFELSAIAIDKNDNLYVADHGNNEIKKISPAGVVTLFAGTGKSGSTDGTVSTATFGIISGIAVDQQGNIYVVDGASFRKITPDGNVSTIPLHGVSGQIDPEGICTDISGNVYITDRLNHMVGKVASNGQVTVISGTHYFTSPWGITANNSGTLFVGDDNIYKLTSSNVVSQLNIGTDGLHLQQLEGVAVDGQGNIYVADSGDGCIDKVTPAGTISIEAGVFPGGSIAKDGVVNLAGFTFPSGVVVDSKGNIFVSDAACVREIAFQ